jgi:dihydroorotate dehydrogenase
MLDAGAVLVQIYTGMIYAGPGLAWQIVLGL